MSNQPVYRYPPRSHASNCPCARCVQCRSRPDPASGLIGFDMGCLAFLLLAGAVAAVVGWAGRNSHAALAVLAGVGVLGLVVWGVVAANRRAVRPPKGRLRVEATVPASGPPMSRMPPTAAESRAMAAPPCQHPHAMKVPDIYGDKVVAYLCPDPPEGCGTQLGVEFGRFRRFCCGTEPGDPHRYSCVHAASVPEVPDPKRGRR